MNQICLRAARSEEEIIWLDDQISEQPDIYNIPILLTFDRKLDRPRLRQAHEILCERNTALNNRFAVDRGSLCVFPSKEQSSIEFWKNYHFTEAYTEIRALSNRPFDTKNGPLMRTYLWDVDGQYTICLIVIHHLVFDGLSTISLLMQFGQFYSDYTVNIPKDEEVLEQLNYSVEWRRRDSRRWKQILSGGGKMTAPKQPVLTSSVIERTAVRVTKILPNSYRRKSDELARYLGVTPYVIWLSAHAEFLQSNCQSDSVMFSIPVSTRYGQKQRDRIGLFASLLPIQALFFEDMRHTDLVAQLWEKLLIMLDARHYPVSEIVADYRKYNVGKNLDLLHSSFSFVDDMPQSVTFGIANVKYEILKTKHSKFWFNFEVSYVGNDVIVSAEAHPIAYDEAILTDHLNSYVTIMESILDSPDETILLRK